MPAKKAFMLSTKSDIASGKSFAYKIVFKTSPARAQNTNTIGIA